MTRTVTVKLGETEIHMPVHFAASEEIAKLVGDPITMLMELGTGKRYLKQSEIVSILHIGATHAGSKLTRDAVGEFVVESGMIDMGAVVAGYLNSICDGGPQRPVAGGKKKAGRTG
jgi:hypothetical protein